MKRIRRLLQQPERPRVAWTPAISAGLLVVGAGLALASWQTQVEQKTQPPAPAMQPAPTAPVSMDPPVADTTHNRVPIWNRIPAIAKPAPALLAQAQQTAPAPQAAQSVEQQLRDALQGETQRARKLVAPYKKWLNEDVAYIITDEERTAFQTTASDEEREQFITQFWLRRDPTPDTPQNEFKAEHYRRIAYANEHYAPATGGLPGWKTDRGRIYITYGPPDEIEDHSSGGFYVRPPEEGGGTTSTSPFQQWRYRYIEGIGNNIIIEFVDPTYTKEFRMTADPSEKDALRYLPGAGATPSSQPMNTFVSVGDGPKATVSITAGKANTNLSLALPSGSGKYDVIARITDVNNRTVANLRDITAAGQLNYPSRFTLAPGSYTFTVVIRDQTSGAMQTSTVNFYVN